VFQKPVVENEKSFSKHFTVLILNNDVNMNKLLKAVFRTHSPMYLHAVFYIALQNKNCFQRKEPNMLFTSLVIDKLLREK
jgi:hypothetical protein